MSLYELWHNNSANKRKKAITKYFCIETAGDAQLWDTATTMKAYASEFQTN